MERGGAVCDREGRRLHRLRHNLPLLGRALPHRGPELSHGSELPLCQDRRDDLPLHRRHRKTNIIHYIVQSDCLRYSLIL